MTSSTPAVTEQSFFNALIAADVDGLRNILSDDFLLIDVMTGSEVPKAALLDVLAGGQLKFEEIERLEFRVREYAQTAVITGRTAMSGIYAGQPFHASSRYTHVFIERNGQWQMVTAQGTQIAGGA